MEGHDSARGVRHAPRSQPLLSSNEEPLADGNLAWDRRQEEYLDALFRELEENPGFLLLRRRVGRILLGIGLVLIFVGALAMVWVKAPELFLYLGLGVNVLAVLCVAAGILLLPESPTPSPASPGAAGDRGGFHHGHVRFRLFLPRFRIRHARH